MTRRIIDRTLYWQGSGNKKYEFDQMGMNHVVDDEFKIKFSQHVRALDKTLYPSGWTIKRKRKNEELYIFPMIVHFNWIAHSKNKIKYMKELNMWFVGEKFAHLRP